MLHIISITQIKNTFNPAYGHYNTIVLSDGRVLTVSDDELIERNYPWTDKWDIVNMEWVGKINQLYLSKLKHMKYLVIEVFNGSYFITNETTIDELVDEMYGGREGYDLEEAKKSFFETYDVFEIKGELVKIN